MQPLFLRAPFLILSLCLSCSLLGKVSQHTLDYALNNPEQSRLRVEGGSLFFTDQDHCCRKVSLASVQTKAPRLYRKWSRRVKDLRRETHALNQIGRLAAQLTQRRIEQEAYRQTLQQPRFKPLSHLTKPKTKKKKRVSFSPVPPQVRTFETPDKLIFEDRHGNLTIFIGHDNRMSYINY